MKTINISDETYELIKDQLIGEEKLDVSKMEDFIGNKVFIRTVTYHLTGKIEKIVGNFFYLSDASWIADSGRFMDAIKNGKLNEVEPVGEVLVNINSITDLFPWKHILPTTQK
jgi:hypothetical protein